MHSSAYVEFIERVNTDGYKQGYNEKLFEHVLPEEIAEIEKIIQERFDAGEYAMSVFMPKLSICNGIKKLEDRAQVLNKNSYAYCEVMRVFAA